MVISVGIDVSKDKHDCFILSSEGETLADGFTIPNTLDGFNFLLRKIQDCTTPQDKIKVGLEATGHYSYNLLGFLLDPGGCTNDCFYAVIRCGPQTLHKYSIPQRGAEVTDQIPL